MSMETNNKPLVLVVDDEEVNRELLWAILEDEGYEVDTAADGLEALERVQENPPDAILLDIMMPNMDGYQVCNELKNKRKTCFIPVIMVTALSDMVSKVMGLEAGADDFINKPIQRDELLVRLASLIRIRRLREELDTSENIIIAMVSALENKDPVTRDHSLMIAAICGQVGKNLKMSEEEREALVWGALLHDIGKIGVPETIIATPPEDRNEKQWEAYREHTLIGDRMLAPLDSLRESRFIVRHHHERLDGSGYPDGLQGDSISLSCQIVGAANALFDYLQENPDNPQDAEDHLLGDAVQGKFDQELVDQILSVRRTLPETLPDFLDLLPPPTRAPGGTILVVDDTPANREVYQDILTSAGFKVIMQEHALELNEYARTNKPDLVLLDMHLPGTSGLEACKTLKADPELAPTPVILVTAEESQGDRVAGLTAGGDEFLTAPVNRHELIARTRSLLRLLAYHRDLERHESVILTLAETLEAKDAYTKGHSSRVGEIAQRLAESMGLETGFCDDMKIAGLLHDIGKVGVPERILNKPGPLNEEEFLTVMTHPGRGFDMCNSLRSVSRVLPHIKYHHERYDGKGYPEGLKGDDIPLGARVLAVADAFDALTSQRSYRKALTPEEALKILSVETGEGKWDPEIFKAMEAMVDSGEAQKLIDPPPPKS